MVDAYENGWPEYAKMVLSDLRELKRGQEDMQEEITRLRIDMGAQKVKASAFGMLGGAIPAAVAILAHWMFGEKK